MYIEWNSRIILTKLTLIETHYKTKSKILLSNTT